MEELRRRLGFSLQQLETAFFGWLAQEFARVFQEALQAIDDWLLKERDSQRWRLKGTEPRTLQTVFGVAITFHRRRYVDRKTGKAVYLLDEVLQLPARKQLSPALAAWVLGQAVLSNTYRGAAQSLETLYGHRVISHESIRQVVLAMGQGLEEEQTKQMQTRDGTRKVPVLFLEVDGMNVPLQGEGKKGRVEEKLLTIHEGWQRRYPGSDAYKLVNKRHFRTQARDFWDVAGRLVESLYAINQDTVVVINGDRAPWIRKGVEEFPNAIYQIDPFHLVRELRGLFGHNRAVLDKLLEAREADVTGATFLAQLAEACAGLTDRKKRQRCQALLNDLKDMPEAVVDYRRRLQSRGIATEDFRGLGAAESQVDTFADRVKHRGRSWSRRGLAAMMEVLCWRNTERLEQVMNRVEELLARSSMSLEEVKREAVRLAKRVVHDGLEVLRGGVPITHAGRTRSGGMSRLMHRLVSGTTK